MNVEKKAQGNTEKAAKTVYHAKVHKIQSYNDPSFELPNALYGSR